MKVTYTPLLQLQRDIYDIPRGPERFQTYLEMVRDAEKDDMKLPLAVMNPMGKEHVPALLDAYLGMGGDKVAAEAVAATSEHLPSLGGAYQVTVVVADDAHGMWTERFSVEYGERFETRPNLRRGWIVGLLWTSERPSPTLAPSAAVTAVYRAAYIMQHGYADTLGEMIAQEGFAHFQANQSQMLDEEELEYTLEILTPHLNSDAYDIKVSGFFGDSAAKALGYEPLGISDRAGMWLGLWQAQRGEVSG